jgi:hypothetical protein
MLTLVCYGVQAQFMPNNTASTTSDLSTGRLNVKSALDDSRSDINVNGRIRLGAHNTVSGDVVMDGKSNTSLGMRLLEKVNYSLQPIFKGDLLINGYWGTAININAGVDPTNDAPQSIIKNTSSFTVNTFTADTILKTLFTIRNNGNVGIGTTSPAEMLSVSGTVLAKKLKVTATGWADYVFEDDYKLPSLKETAAYIKANKHLPEIPTAEEVKENGQDVGEMNRLLLKKVEELTLHLIELQAKVEKLEAAQK